MYIPLWVAVVAMIGSIGGSAIGAFALIKNNNRTVEATLSAKLAELSVTEESNLRDDQRELITTLKTNTASFQDLLTKYAEAIINEAKTQTQIQTLNAEFIRLRDDFEKMKSDRDDLLKKAACVPLLEEQLKNCERTLQDRDKTIRQTAAVIKQQAATISDLTEKLDTANTLSSVAGRAQERAEGAKMQAERVIEQITSTLSP